MQRQGAELAELRRELRAAGDREVRPLYYYYRPHALHSLIDGLTPSIDHLFQRAAAREAGPAQARVKVRPLYYYIIIMGRMH